MMDRRILSHFDWILIGSALLLALFGVAMIYSTHGSAGPVLRKSFYFRQFLWILIGFVGLLLPIVINWGTIVRFSYVLYGLALVGLLLVAVMGKTGMGSQRWISLGPLSIQPSEIMKVALILALAKYLGEKGNGLGRPRQILIPALLICLPAFLVLRQPDLGTAIVLLFVGLGMLLLFGLPLRYLMYSIAGAFLAFPFLWTLLREYQKQRLLAFLNPYHDPLGSGYHIIQSRIAVGSGKVLGKGWMAAQQSQLNFLPEHHTDFIFAVSAEQFGFIGSLLILILYLLIVSRAFLTARQARDLFSQGLASGLAIMLAFQVIINVGMVTGLMPVVGIPLPLMSYGGTSMLATMTSIGLLLAIRMRKYLY